MYYIGIDGGGTKTEAILCDKAGKLLARKIKKGCNPNDIGIRATAALLKEMVLELCTEKEIFSQDTCIFAGVSGCGVGDIASQVEEILSKDFLRVKVGSDILNVIEAGLDGKDGVIVIAGTGSSFAVNQGGSYKIYGGNGYMFEEGGSGFSIAKDGFIAALNEEDGIGAHTKVTKLYQEKLGAKVKASLGEIYKGGKRFVASFAPLVFSAFQAGDAQAERILSANAEYVVKTLRDVCAISGVERRIALAGGLFNNPFFANLVMQETEGEVNVLTQAPVWGALRRAQRIYGI